MEFRPLGHVLRSLRIIQRFYNNSEWMYGLWDLGHSPSAGTYKVIQCCNEWKYDPINECYMKSRWKLKIEGKSYTWTRLPIFQYYEILLLPEIKLSNLSGWELFVNKHGLVFLQFDLTYKHHNLLFNFTSIQTFKDKSKHTKIL